MRMGQSWRRVGILFCAMAICMLGVLWRPAALTARTTSGNNSTRHAFYAVNGWSGERSSAASQAQEAGAKKVTAGDAYMNIQVLKDIPSDQLLPSMRYITVALGVECNFCHDTKSYDSDDKPEKATARKMMTMMFGINKDNFNGRREVTCYTCHRGVAHAAQMPTAMAVVPSGTDGDMPAADHGPGGGAAHSHDERGGAPQAGAAGAAPSGAASGAMPTIDEILAKYTESLGGATAVQKITTLDEKGTMEMPAHGMHAATEVWRKAPDKEAADLHTPAGDFLQGFNGTAGWQVRPGKGADDLVGDELVRTKQWASFIPGLDLKQNFSRAQVVAIDKIDDHDAYRVIAFRAPPASGQVRFYFDKDSGLLLRVSERIESALGALPQDTDYSDYRDVNGVKIPFNVLAAHADGPTIYKWEQIQANVPIEDSRFDKPAAKASQ